MIAASATMAQACAVNPTPVMTAAQPLAVPADRVTLVEQDDAESGATQRLRFASELKAALAQHRIVLVQDSPLIAEYTISAQPSDLSLSEPATAGDAGNAKSQLSRKARWWDKCKVEKIRGSLTLLDRATGTLAAKSEAEYFSCKGDLSKLDDLADLLVKAVVTSQ